MRNDNEKERSRELNRLDSVKIVRGDSIRTWNGHLRRRELMEDTRVEGGCWHHWGEKKEEIKVKKEGDDEGRNSNINDSEELRLNCLALAKEVESPREWKMVPKTMALKERKRREKSVTSTFFIRGNNESGYLLGTYNSI